MLALFANAIYAKLILTALIFLIMESIMRKLLSGQ